jgi:MFS family permease
MRHTAIAISSLLLGISLIMLGNGLLGTLLGVRMTLAEIPTLATGAVMAAYFGGLAVGAIRGSTLIATVGHIRSFTAFASIYSAASLLHALYFDPVFWGILRFLEGACMAGLFLCTESWLNERATNDTRGRIMSLYMILIYLAQAFGQFLLLATPPDTFVLFAIVSAIASIGAVPIALTRQPQPKPPLPSRMKIRDLYRLSPLGVVGSFASGLILGAFYGMGPAYAPLAGLDIDATARFMSVAIIGGLGMQWPLGVLSDRMDRRRVIVGVCGGILLVSVAMVILTRSSEGAILFLSAAFGAVAFALYPLSVTHASDFARDSDFVGVVSGLLLAYSLGATVGPVASSAAMTATGASGLFVFTGIVAAASVGFGVWRMRQRDSVPADRKNSFAALPRTTPAISELDPRAPADEELKDG